MKIDRVQPIYRSTSDFNTKSNLQNRLVKPVSKSGSSNDKGKDDGSFDRMFEQEMKRLEERPSVKRLKR